MNQARPSLTFACVYNDAATLAECLVASLHDFIDQDDMELITVDNRQHQFTSAGAALNHAVRMASHDVVVMTHQDAYVHDPKLIQSAATHLYDGQFGLLGPVGVNSEGFVVGHMRDRTSLIGRPSPAPSAVDSLDEVLMMAPRKVLLDHPLTEDAELSWHAYGVELSARLRRSDLETGACDLAVTHNSRNLNTALLEQAHARVAALNPNALPLHTTCGTIGDVAAPAPSPWRRVRRTAGRMRRARRARIQQRHAGQAPPPQVDLRERLHELDWGTVPLSIVNLDVVGFFHARGGDPVELSREGKPVSFQAVDSIDRCFTALDQADAEQSSLLTNLSAVDLRELHRVKGDYLLGAYAGEYWVLTGPILDSVPTSWGV